MTEVIAVVEGETEVCVYPFIQDMPWGRCRPFVLGQVAIVAIVIEVIEVTVETVETEVIEAIEDNVIEVTVIEVTVATAVVEAAEQALARFDVLSCGKSFFLCAVREHARE